MKRQQKNIKKTYKIYRRSKENNNELDIVSQRLAKICNLPLEE